MIGPLYPHQAQSASGALASFHPGANFIIGNDFPTLCCGNATADLPFKPSVPGHQVIDGFLDQFVRSAMRSRGELIQPRLRFWFAVEFHFSSLKASRNPGADQHAHVLVTISGAPATAGDVAGYFEPEEWAAARHDDITPQEVRRAVSTIPGSLADAVIASREQR
jgi:hypothetical protein